MKELTSHNFDQEVNQNSLMLVDFYADWCGPCSVLADLLKQVTSDLPVKIGKLDVERNDDITERFRITRLPTLVFFKDGTEVQRMVGIASKNELQNLVTHFAGQH